MAEGVDLYETAALAASRALFYPSLAYSMIRSKVDATWEWHSAITEEVILGALPLSLQPLKQLGITAVVTLNQEFELFLTAEHYEELGIRHLWLPTTDYMFAPSLPDLHRGVDFISQHARSGGRVYVHCKAGRGRSATLLLCYLAKEHGMAPAEAFQFVKAKRPQIGLSRPQWEAVERFWASLSPPHVPIRPLPAMAPKGAGAAGAGDGDADLLLTPQAPGTPAPSESIQRQLQTPQAAGSGQAAPSGTPEAAAEQLEPLEDSPGGVDPVSGAAAGEQSWWRWVRSAVSGPPVAGEPGEQSELPCTLAQEVATAAAAEGSQQQGPATPVPAEAGAGARVMRAPRMRQQAMAHAAVEGALSAGSSPEQGAQPPAVEAGEAGTDAAQADGAGEGGSWWGWMCSTVGAQG